MKQRRKQIINLIYKVQEDNNNIKKDIITNSFFRSSIAFSMSAIDDEKFNFPDKIDEVIGKTALVDIEQDTLIDFDMLE